MEFLKKFFPYSFGADSVAALAVKIIILLVAGAVAGFLIGILALIPLLGVIFALACSLIDLYVLISIVLAVLDFMKVLK